MHSCSVAILEYNMAAIHHYAYIYICICGEITYHLMIHIVVAPLAFNACHILSCLVSRAYVTDTTSYVRGFAWTLLDRACGQAILSVVVK